MNAHDKNVAARAARMATAMADAEKRVAAKQQEQVAGFLRVVFFGLAAIGFLGWAALQITTHEEPTRPAPPVYSSSVGEPFEVDVRETPDPVVPVRTSANCDSATADYRRCGAVDWYYPEDWSSVCGRCESNWDDK